MTDCPTSLLAVVVVRRLDAVVGFDMPTGCCRFDQPLNGASF